MGGSEMTFTQFAAYWGMILSTFSVVWQLWQWWKRGALRVDVMTDMQMYPAPRGKQDQLLLMVEVANVGSQPVTLKLLHGAYYTSLWNRLRNKNPRYFVTPSAPEFDQLPHVLRPGEIWRSGFEQDSDLEQMLGSGHLLIRMTHSLSKRDAATRVRRRRSPKDAD